MSHNILLLHGQPGAARDWDRVIAAIGAGPVTIAPDRPGWDGHSRAVGLAGNADAALAQLDAKGVARAVVVGHSFGGAVAAWLAATHPERVEALVLVAPSANAASLYALDRWLATPVAGYVAGATLLGGVGVALAERRVRRFVARLSGLEQTYLRATGGMLRAPLSWGSFFIEQQALIRELPALESRLDRILAPTTIVAGSADVVVPAASARRLAAQIQGADLVLLESAGHLLPMQEAQRLAEIIAWRTASDPAGQQD